MLVSSLISCHYPHVHPNTQRLISCRTLITLQASENTLITAPNQAPSSFKSSLSPFFHCFRFSIEAGSVVKRSPIRGSCRTSQCIQVLIGRTSKREHAQVDKVCIYAMCSEGRPQAHTRPFGVLRALSALEGDGTGATEGSAGRRVKYRTCTASMLHHATSVFTGPMTAPLGTVRILCSLLGSNICPVVLIRSWIRR